MDHSFVNRLERFYSKSPVAISLFLAITTLSLDYFTGRSVHFFIFHLIPIGLLAWNRHLRTAMTLAVLLSAIRIWFFVLWGNEQLLHYAETNALLTTLLFSFVSYLICKISLQNCLLKKQV